MCDRASYMKMTRGTNLMQQLWFIITNYLCMYRATMCPSSGVQVVYYCVWCSALGVVAVVPRSLCALCVSLYPTQSDTNLGYVYSAGRFRLRFRESAPVGSAGRSGFNCDSERRRQSAQRKSFVISAGAHSGGRCWRVSADSPSQTVYWNDFLILVRTLGIGVGNWICLHYTPALTHSAQDYAPAPWDHSYNT
jgi:hypothetical protein